MFKFIVADHPPAPKIEAARSLIRRTPISGVYGYYR
jgi:hypothetical protein